MCRFVTHKHTEMILSANERRVCSIVTMQFNFFVTANRWKRSTSAVSKPCTKGGTFATLTTHRQRREGDAPSSCCARRPDTDSKRKSSVESAKLKKFALQLLLDVSNHHLPNPPFLFHQIQLIYIPLVSFTQSGRTVSFSLCFCLSTLRCCTHPEIPHSALISPFVSYLLSPYVSPLRLSHNPPC
jgi:hypothetical protein